MAHPIDLDPGRYSGTYKLIGGALALDFANLLSYRGTDREHDWLDPATNARRWAASANISPPGDGNIATIIDFREVVARVFLAIVDRRTPAAEDIDAIGRQATLSRDHRRLRFAKDATSAEWVDTSLPFLVGVALSAVDLLTSAEAVRRVTACDECLWLFIDTTRNRSRRWCDPADCGNRTRQRRHYRRHTQSDP